MLLVELDGYWLDGVVLGFEVDVPLMPLVPVVELDVLEVPDALGSAELEGVVLDELGYELELCGLVLVELCAADELEGDVVAVEVELDGLELLEETAVPDEVFAEALVPAPFALTAILSFTLVTPGTAFATSFAFLRSALEATEPSRVTTPFFTLACTPLRAGSAASWSWTCFSSVWSSTIGFALVDAVVLLLLVPIVDWLWDVEPAPEASGTVPALPLEPLGDICAMLNVVAPANASVKSNECVFMDIAPPFGNWNFDSADTHSAFKVRWTRF